MYEIIIDTCNDRLNIVLTENGKYVFNSSVDSIKKHSELLLFTIDEVLKNKNIEINDIACFCCVVGPGSFTGIRVGISTVKAFSFALSKPCKSITNLQSLAYTIDSHKCIGLCDAGRNSVYFQAFCNYLPVSEIQMIENCRLQDTLKDFPEYAIACNQNIADIACNIIDDNSKGLIIACNAAEYINSDSLEPCYIRRSQAEENYNENTLGKSL